MSRANHQNQGGLEWGDRVENNMGMHFSKKREKATNNTNQIFLLQLHHCYSPKHRQKESHYPKQQHW